ncbi:hypothetical protein KF840_22165 [bacterium]|nr:hypothetical protein [bacterium]
MHYLLLVPFYVFIAIGVFLLLSILCRVLRLKLSANALAVTAVTVGVVIVLLPLFEGIQLADYTGRRLLLVAGVTFVLATIDTLLEPLLPLPLDAELADL